MNVPEKVIAAARELIEQYGESFEFLGVHEGQEAYLFKFPEDDCSGFPFLFLYDGNEAIRISGPMALDFVNSYIEDVDEVEVE